MIGRNALTEPEIDEMLRRYRTKEPITAIAAAFGVNRAYPGKLAKRRGLPLRAPLISQSLLDRPRSSPWRPEPEAPHPPALPNADIRTRLLAGEPMLLVAADLDLGLGEILAAAKAAP